MGRFGTSWENSRVKSMLRQGLVRRSKKKNRYSITWSARSRND
jgi:DNA-binding IclR family transcriptional regulator